MTTAAKTIECTFDRRPALLALVMAVLCLVLLKPSQADVAVWNQWEQTLTSSRTYANPYQQVTLSVTYTGADGQKITGYGLDMTALPTAMQAKWFDPVTGKYAPVSAAIPTDRPHTFVRPTGWEDAVLLLMRPTDTARE